MASIRPHHERRKRYMCWTFCPTQYTVPRASHTTLSLLHLWALTVSERAVRLATVKRVEAICRIHANWLWSDCQISLEHMLNESSMECGCHRVRDLWLHAAGFSARLKLPGPVCVWMRKQRAKHLFDKVQDWSEHDICCAWNVPIKSHCTALAKKLKKWPCIINVLSTP